MAKFEVVSKYANDNIPLPTRGTACAAGYDFVVAKNTMILPYDDLKKALSGELINVSPWEEVDLETMATATKKTKAKPTLVPTGIKCKLDKNQYLELSVRSSTPLKYWLILANSVGIIDADYYNNPDNEGEIFFQMINLSPEPIYLHKGDKIGQGIIHTYEITEDDSAIGERVGGFGSTGA